MGWALALWLAIIVSPFCCCATAIELKDSNGKYKHHDPEVRAELLEIARALRKGKLYDKSEHLYRYLIKTWDAKEYSDSYQQACKGLFGMLVDSGQLGSYEEKTDICPASLIREEFLKLSWLAPVTMQLRLSDMLIPKWHAVGVVEELSEICSIHGSAISLRGVEDDYHHLLKFCADIDVIKGGFYAARLMSNTGYLKSIEKYSVKPWRLRVSHVLSEDISAIDIYLKRIKNWSAVGSLQAKEQACSEAVLLSLAEESQEDVIASLEKLQCSEMAIRRGFFHWAGIGEWRGDVKASINHFKQLIEDWNRNGDKRGVRLACQHLYWLLARSGDEDDTPKTGRACPDLEYSRNEWAPSQLPAVDAYLSAANDGNYRRVRGSPNRWGGKRLSGWVIVEFSISSEGKIINPKIVGNSSTESDREQRRVNKVALSMIKKMLYIPKIIDGKPVETHGVVETFRF